MTDKKTYKAIKRSFDIILAIAGILLLSVPILIIGVIIKLTSKGPVIHWSKRVGIDNSFFMMAKFRTMRMHTPVRDIKKLHRPEKYYTSIGNFLRKFSLDELPQLYNILIGEMSFVGPRPVLYNHFDIITLRKEKGINMIKPGLTGLAQIKGKSDLSAKERVYFDEYYMANMSLMFDFKIIIMTNVFLVKDNYFK